MREVIFLLFFIPLVIYAKSYTLDELIDISLQNNLSLQTTQLKYQMEQEELDKSRASFLPQAYIDLEYKKVDEYPVVVDGVEIKKRKNKLEGTFYAEQTLYDRKKSLDYKKQKYNIELSNNEYLNEKDKVTTQVINYYLELIFKHNQIQMFQTKIEYLDSVIDKSKIKFDNGMISRSEYEESISQRDELIIKKIELELEYKNNITQLEQLAKVREIEIKNSDDFTIPTLETYSFYENNLENNYDLLAQKFKTEQSKINSSIAWSGFEPKLSVNYEYFDTDIKGIDPTHTTTLLLKIPLFDGLYDYNNYEKSKLELLEQNKEYENIKDTQNKKIKNIYNKLIAYQKIINKYPSIINAKKLRVETLKEEFQIGRKSLIDLLDEINLSIEKENKFLEYKYQYLSSFVELNYTINTINEQFLKNINGHINGNE